MSNQGRETRVEGRGPEDRGQGAGTTAQESEIRKEVGAQENGEPFITKEEVARRMRKPVRTIENWMREHRIPFYRVGHSVRFRWSDVQVHFNKCYRVAPIEPEDEGKPAAS
jgi:excisionase family DNA binding protein